MAGTGIGRRAFVLTGAGALGVTAAQRAVAARQTPAPTLLVLGGTGFIGPHLVRLAVARGHRVTIFTRGRRAADLPDAVERLVGDRNGQLDALTGRRWDAVIDDSATNPAWVRQSTARLASSGRYLFTSSTGVYYPYLRRGLTEADAVHTDLRRPDDASERYGTSKAACEDVVGRAFRERGLVVRPTYIAGPGDPTDRFTYWPVRLAEGGDILAPGDGSGPIQYIDVRDLAAFMLTLVERRASGVYNVVGPATPTTIADFLRDAAAALGLTARLTWVDEATLASRRIDGMVPWILARGDDLGHTSIRTTRSTAAGLTCRPVADTVRDTLTWFRSLPAERQAAAKWALSREDERALLRERTAR